MALQIFPTNYKITLEPDLDTFKFKGTELITIEIEKKTEKLSLDSIHIKVDNCFLIDGGKRIPLEFKLLNDKLEISLSEKVEDGENEIEIEFEGELNDKLAGFYRSEYQEDGKTKYLATTQFEAADARQAFPCFDEPLYKATFDITLVVDKDLKAISNMPRKEEKILENGKKSVTFEKTPIMSTYLVYFGVGEFEIVHKSYKNVDVRGITTKGKTEAMEFGLECAKKSLEYFENYFHFQYPLPKLDLIAIPDFASGAMENWGAITFRENALLFYPEKSSLSTKQRVAEVVAHELAHQWFGNLVTMKWWDDLWLNESFATFMAYKVLNHYWPEWDIWTDYIMTTVFEGMYLDSLKSSHPIKVTVKTVEEMNELFDEIAYDKGGSVLRMIERFMGEEYFKKGLQEYVKTYQYKNTEAKELWNTLEKHGTHSIVSLVEKFVTQVGFPHFSVEHKNRKVIASQKRFVFGDEKDDSIWNVPLLMKFNDDSRNETTLELKQESLDEASKNLISINADYGAFFISQYDETILSKIGDSITKLNSKEKIGLLHDLYYLAKFKKQHFSIFENFVSQHFIAEKDPVVLFYLLEILDSIYSLTEKGEIKTLLLQHSKRAIELVGMNPGEKDSTHTTFLRASALSILSQFDDKEVQAFLRDTFELYLKNAELVHPDLLSVTLINAVWSDEKNYEKVLRLYKHSSTQEEQVKLLHALANVKSPEKLKEMLDFCLGPDVRFANVIVAVNGASKNPNGQEVALRWVLDNWNEFGKRVGGHGGVLLRRFVKIVIPVCGIGHEEEIKQFIQKNKIAGLEKTFDQVWEELQINSSFVKSINEKIQ